MAMTDRDLLELAAKAAGVEIVGISDDGMAERADGGWWNPLEDDGDAIRLAMELSICIEFIPDCDTVQVYQQNEYAEPRNVQVEAFDAFGMRRAIVRAAAEIGESMEKPQ